MFATKLLGRRRAGWVAALATVGVLAGLPAIAHGAVVGSMSINFPATVTVGQTGVPASITLRNLNTGANAAGTNTVCNAGDAAPPCAPSEAGIVLTPSCSQLSGTQCVGADPGVFAISPTGTGRAGTACAGTTFNIAVVDTTYGTVGFSPLPGGTRVALPAAGSTCSIDFSLSVQRAPRADQNATEAGLQTTQAATHTQFAGPLAPGALSDQAPDTSDGTTVRAVQQPPPTIATVASANTAVGGAPLSATATVTGRVSPLAGATIDFRLFGPDDATCAGAPPFASLDVPYPVGGGPVSSAPFSPTLPGTYRWTATYSGDANNVGIVNACDTAGTTTLVSPAVVPPDRDGDGVRDSADKCVTFNGDLPNGCPSLLNADVRGVWRVNELYSQMLSLTVRATPGSRIELRCTAKKKKVCGFKLKVVKSTTKRMTSLTKNFSHKRIFPAGTSISVRVTKLGTRGSYERLLTRTGRRLPRVIDRCLNASNQVQRCP